MAFSAAVVVGGGGGESICCTGSFCDFNKTLTPFKPSPVRWNTHARLLPLASWPLDSFLFSCVSQSFVSLQGRSSKSSRAMAEAHKPVLFLEH